MIASELLNSMYILPRHLRWRETCSLSLYISFVGYSVIESVRQIDHLLFSKLTCTLLHKAHQYMYSTVPT
jgi:hypothetical protein